MTEELLQLANSRTSSQQYKEIADSAEKRLAENNNAAKALKADLETRLKKAVEEREAVEGRMRELEEASRAAPVSCEAELRQGLAQAQESLRLVSDQLETARRVEAESRAEAERQMALAQEAHLKYQNEIVLHAQDVEALNKLKEATNSHK